MPTYWPQSSRYVKQSISLAPDNLSAWNYLRGVLDVNQISYYRLSDFVKPYTVTVAAPNDLNANLVDLENPPPPRGTSLPGYYGVLGRHI
jgi:protein farnesyltransferase/geranylgeranyltransferase type-1 subunit alpha